jgi:cyanophycin synthetase
MALPYVSDSRRLTGASLVLPVPGAILEVAAPAEHKTKLRVYWRTIVRKLLNSMGWGNAQIEARDQGPSQILAISAPIDGLLTATYINEAAWELVLVKAGLLESTETVLNIVDDLLSKQVREANAALNALYRAAKLRGVTTLLGDKDLSLGEGADAKVYPLDDLPSPMEIAWTPKRRKLPIALVTGTNGKTSTVRLLAHMLRHGQRCVGFCSTDFVQIGSEVLERDDYSGPTGARFVLRHPNTEIAVLEVARGGMLRRGLQVHDADVGIVTNIADDHLGENGIHTLMQLAEAKFTVTRGLHSLAPIVVNADDAHCRVYARKLERPIFWFGLTRPTASMVRGKRPRAGLVYLQNEVITLEVPAKKPGGTPELIPLAHVRDCPVTLLGSARYNIANCLAAVAGAFTLGVSIDAMIASLKSFSLNPNDNPGRANIYPIKGAKLMIDYGHNPDGIAAILDSVSVLRAAEKASSKQGRLLVGVGIAGDRSDDAARAIGVRVAQCKADQVYVKELIPFLRGRPQGELSGILLASLHQHGHSKARTEYFLSDAEMLDSALKWLKPGDFAVLFLHENVAQLSVQLSAMCD